MIPLPLCVVNVLIGRYTFTYLGAFFLLADGLNTTGFVIGIVQNEHISFSFLESTYLGLSQAATSTLSCYVFWYIQRHFKIQTKWMFGVTNVITVFIPFWGMVRLSRPSNSLGADD